MSGPRREAWLTLAAGVGPLLLGLAVYRQGFNLLDDGLWVLGTKLLGTGGFLYRDLFSIYGPARYLLLWPLTWLFGPSALALAVLKALATGAAGAAAFALSRRLGAGRWSWLAPIGVAAIGPVDPRYAAVAWFAWLLGRDPAPTRHRRYAVVCGLAWGAVSLFGLDALLYASIVAVGALGGPRVAAALHRRSAGVESAATFASDPTAWLRFAISGAAVLAVAGLVALLSGVAGSAWWETVVYPLTRFRAAMGIPWWQTLGAAAELGRPFALVETGEVLPAAWPGHAAGAALGIRALFAGLALIPLLGLRRCLRGGDAAWCAAVALAFCGWVTMSGRGGIEHLRPAWLGSLALLPALLGNLPARYPKPTPARSDRLGRWGSVIASVVALLACAPFLAESLWLATHADRAGLVRWGSPGARVLVSADRARAADRVAALVDSLSTPSAPVLVWPAQPGLNVVLDRPPATPQATLLAGEVRDPAAVLTDLAAHPPQVAVIGRVRGIVAGKLTLRSLSPPLWHWLRENYAVAGAVRRDPDEYWILARVPGGPNELLSRPLSDRLPDVEARLLDSSLALAGPGHTLGQTMQVGPGGLAGLQVRCVTERAPVRLPLRLRIWGRAAGGEFMRPLGELTSTVEVRQNLEKISWAFTPIPGTADQEILWTVELLEDSEIAVALGCHQFDPSDPDGDAYADGSARQDGVPLSADLYFLAF